MKSAPPHIVVRSGGQTGVDRAALEAAAALALPRRGWCPRGGWAEDRPDPPGIRDLYPDLEETPSRDPRQRTAWNVRDADATLVILPGDDRAVSPGTEFTIVCADLVYERAWHVADPASDGSRRAAVQWLSSMLRGSHERPLVVNVAGPRESECPGIRRLAYVCLLRLLQEVIPEHD